MAVDYDTDQTREALAKLLASKQSRPDKIKELIGMLNEAAGDDMTKVEVSGARVAVRTVSEYGLTIELDAADNAVSVESIYGLDIVE